MERPFANGVTLTQEYVLRELYSIFASTNGVDDKVARAALSATHDALGSVARQEEFSHSLGDMLIEASLSALIKAVRSEMPTDFPASRPYSAGIARMYQRAEVLQRLSSLESM